MGSYFSCCIPKSHDQIHHTRYNYKYNSSYTYPDDNRFLMRNSDIYQRSLR